MNKEGLHHQFLLKVILTAPASAINHKQEIKQGQLISIVNHFTGYLGLNRPNPTNLEISFANVDIFIITCQQRCNDVLDYIVDVNV